MAKKKEDKKLTKDQSIKKIETLKKDLFNIRFKKINNQVENPAQYNQIKKNIARLYSNLKGSKWQREYLKVKLQVPKITKLLLLKWSENIDTRFTAKL